MKVKKQLPAGKYTVLIFDSLNESEIKDCIVVGGTKYKTELAYDLPNSIGVIGHGDFVGKDAVFS